MASRTWSLTNVRRGEVRVVFLMLVYGFLAMASYYVIKPVRNAVFVERLGAENLPYVYILTAIVVSLVMVGYSRWVNRVGHAALLLGTFAFLASNLVFFRWLLLEETFLASGAFYIWGKLYPLLLVSQFWLVGNLLFTTRQAKRLFGPVGVGLILGGVAGSALAATAAEVVGSENLLLAAAAILVVCAVVVLALRPDMRDHEGGRRSGRLVEKLSADAVRLLLDSPHLRWIATILFLTILVSTLVDWQFNRAVELFVTGEDAKTRFFGHFNLALNVASVAIQVLLTSFVLRKFGVGTALLALPAGLLIASAGLVLLPLLLVAALAKGTEGALRYSLDQSSRELLFLPVPTDVKYKVKPLIDLAIYRGGTGVGGVLLLIFTNGLGLETRGVAVVALALLGLWVYATFRVRREFKDAVRRLIGARDLDLNELIVQRTREEKLDGVRETLLEGEEDDIVYVLGLLRHQDPRAFKGEIRALLQHDSAELRARALTLLERIRDDGVVPEARALLVDPDLDVRIAAMQYVCRFGTDDPPRELRDALADEAFGIRAAAIAVILRHSGRLRGRDADELRLGEVEDAGGAAWEALSSEEDLEARMFAAQLLVDADPDSERGRALMRLLLEDPDPSVRHAALQAAGSIESDDFAKLLVTRLARPEDRAAAEAALSKRAGANLGLLFRCLSDPRAAPAQRMSIPRILRSAVGQETVDRLMGALGEEETPRQLRFEILGTLHRLRRLAPELDFRRHDLQGALEREVDEAYLWARRVHVLGEGASGGGGGGAGAGGGAGGGGADGGAGSRGDFLESILLQRMREAAERAFRILGLEYDLDDLEAAFAALGSSDEVMRQRGFELVDNALPLRKRVLFDPLLNPEKSWRERAAAAEARFRVQPESRREVLDALCCDEGACVRALARVELGLPVGGKLTPAVLREEMASRISLVLEGPHNQGGIDIMDILRRADALRQCALFSELRGEELAGIAALVEAHRFRKGERIDDRFPEGYLYIVVEGRLELREGDARLASAGPGELFFDPSLLDGREAEGSMLAVEDSRVLRLSRQAFTRILEERFAVVRALLGHLASLLRAQSAGAVGGNRPEAVLAFPHEPVAQLVEQRTFNP